MSKKPSRHSNLRALQARSERDFQQKANAKLASTKVEILNSESFRQAMVDHARAIDEVSDNPCWDELNHTAADCELQIASHGALAAQLADEVILRHVADLPLLQKNVVLMQRDLGELNEKFQKVRKLHAGRSGNALNPDDLMASLHINQQYVTVVQHHQGVVLPTAIHLAEQYHGALEALKAADPAAAKDYQDRMSMMLNGVAEQARANTAARQATLERQKQAEAAKKLSAAQDPTVVTDVEVKSN